MFDRKITSTKQGKFIRSYNLLIDTMNKLGIKTTLVKLNTTGVCNGLSYAYKWYAQQGKREEYVSTLIKIASIEREEQFISLLERKPEKAFFESSSADKQPLIQINNILPMLETICLNQRNNSLTNLDVLWDKTYSFICEETQLTSHLKNACWKDGESAFVYLGFHVFYIEKCNKGFYLFEPNAIDQGAIHPLITSEKTLAQTIFQNIKPFLSLNGYIAFSLQFISNQLQSKNTTFDDAILQMTNQLDAYPSLKNLCTSYQQKKLSRLDCALAIKYIVAREKIVSEQLSPFFAIVENHFKSEQHFVNHSLQYNRNNINTAAYKINISLLYLAVLYGQMYFIKILLRDKSIDVNQKTTNGSTPLIVGADNGVTAIVAALLKHPRINVNLADDKKITALYLSSQNGHAPVVALLSKHPAIKTNQANHNGVTALYIAAQNGHISVVEILLAQTDIDVNQANVHGRTPLAIALYKENAAIATLLTTRGAVVQEQAAPRMALS